MKLLTTRVRLGDSKVRARTVLTGEQCPPNGMQSVRGQWDLLSTLVHTPSLGVCSGKQFEVLKMTYNGSAWQIEMEAIVPGDD